MEQQIGFERAAQAVPEFDVGSRPGRVDLARAVETQQQAHAEQRDQGRRLQLVFGAFHEAADLPRRLAAAAADVPAAVTEVGRVELPDPVVRQSGTAADGARPGLVADHPEREFELVPFVRVAVVRQTHFASI